MLLMIIFSVIYVVKKYVRMNLSGQLLAISREWILSAQPSKLLFTQQVSAGTMNEIVHLKQQIERILEACRIFVFS